MADDFWSGLGGLLGSGNADLYGDLLTDKQRKALLFKEIGGGLDEISRRAAEAGKPSLMPGGKGWLGSALSGYGAGANAASEGMLKTMQTAQALRKAKRDQELTEQYFLPLLRDLTAKEKQHGLPPGSLTSTIQPPAAPTAPPGMPAAPLTPTTPPGASPGPGPAGVPTPPPEPGYTGPTNAELGAPPLPAAPGGTTTGLPARIGMRGTGPDAVMIDLDTGQPIQSSPGGPITKPPPLKTTEADPSSQFAGLLSGGGLDQVVGPDGQPLTGQGVLPGLLASYGGAPDGMPPFRLASATPTSGTTPGAAGPSRDDPRGVVPYIRERATALGIDPNVAERVARSEGVGTFQSSVIQKNGRREPSWGAFQLYTGGGMGNDFQRDTGLDPSDPKNEKATIDYALQKARTGGWTPWHGAKGAGISARAGIPGGEDYVIPSGRGIPASALRNVADTGTAPGAGAPTGGGTIPGTNMTPEKLAALNAMSKLLGHGDMFGSLLETYYKSPNYLTEAARARAAGENDPLILEQKKRIEYKIDTELKPGLEAAVAREMNGPLKERAQNQAEIDRRTKELEQMGAAGTKVEEATVAGDDGKPVQKKMTALEFAIRQKLTADRQTAERQATGTATVKPGDIIGTPVLSPEETARQTQRGKTAEEMVEVEVWTPNGPVKQTMTNQEKAAREKLTAGRGGGGAPQIGDIINKPAMTSADQKISDALGEDFITLRRQAVAADKTIRDTHTLRSKLDSGMFTGLDANLNLFLARLGDTLGYKNLSDNKKIENTQVYIAQLGSEVLSMAQALKPVSNVDLTFLNSMAGGQNLSAASIRQLLDMREEYARLAIQRHNEEAAGRNPAIFQGARRELPMPPAYQPRELMTPSGNRATINR